jgi:hypothetical protein
LDYSTSVQRQQGSAEQRDFLDESLANTLRQRGRRNRTGDERGAASAPGMGSNPGTGCRPSDEIPDFGTSLAHDDLAILVHYALHQTAGVDTHASRIGLGIVTCPLTVTSFMASPLGNTSSAVLPGEVQPSVSVARVKV